MHILYIIPVSVSSEQESPVGRNDVVKQRKTITKPIVQNIFSESTVNIDINENNATSTNNNKQTAEIKAAPPNIVTPSSSNGNISEGKTLNIEENHANKNTTKSTDDNKISTLIHMTSKDDEEESYKAKPEVSYMNFITKYDREIDHNENEYVEIIESQETESDFKIHLAQQLTEELSDSYDDRHDADTISVNSTEMYRSTAESIFFGDVEPVITRKPRKVHLTGYGDDNISQNSQTSA